MTASELSDIFQEKIKAVSMAGRWHQAMTEDDICINWTGPARNVADTVKGKIAEIRTKRLAR